MNDQGTNSEPKKSAAANFNLRMVAINKKRVVEQEMESRIQKYKLGTEAKIRKMEQSILEAQKELDRIKIDLVFFEEQEKSIRSERERIFTLVEENKSRIVELARASLKELTDVRKLRESMEKQAAGDTRAVVDAIRGLAGKYGLSLDLDTPFEAPAADETFDRLEKSMTSVLEILEGEKAEVADEEERALSSPPEAPAEGKPPAREEAPAGKKRILIVEDDPVSARILEHFLLSRGDTAVETASDAGEALKGLERRPNLILVDISFPGMDVGTFLGRAVKGDPPIPAIVIGSYSEQIKLQEAVDKGASGFFTKPIPVHEMMKMVDDLFTSQIHIPAPHVF